MTYIVTAVSANMWNDYKLFHLSLNQWLKSGNIQLVVLALGLPGNLLRQLKSQPHSHTISVDCVGFEDIGQEWAKWFKPAFIDRLPERFNTCLWLDCDIIVARSPVPLIDHIQQGFTVMADNFAPRQCHNRQSLYKRLGIKTDGRVLNSGVVGFDRRRDQRILRGWLNVVERARTDRLFREGISLHDQGALLLTLHRLDLAHLIIDRPEWNWPASRAFIPPTRGILETVAADNPSASIIHFAGAYKLSRLCSVDDESLCKLTRPSGVHKIVSGFAEPLAIIASALRRRATHGDWVHFADEASVVLAARRGGGFPFRYLDRHDFNRAWTFGAELAYFDRSDFPPNSRFVTVMSSLSAEIDFRMSRTGRSEPECLDGLLADLDRSLKIADEIIWGEQPGEVSKGLGGDSLPARDCHWQASSQTHQSFIEFLDRHDQIVSSKLSI